MKELADILQACERIFAAGIDAALAGTATVFTTKAHESNARWRRR